MFRFVNGLSWLHRDVSARLQLGVAEEQGGARHDAEASGSCTILSIKNKSYSITADLDVPKSGTQGVIVAQGGNTNGWSLCAKAGKLKYCNGEGRPRSPDLAGRALPGCDGAAIAKFGLVRQHAPVAP